MRSFSFVTSYIGHFLYENCNVFLIVILFLSRVE